MPLIVFPMAGLSRRFSEAGYRLPKYMLPLDGVTVFDRVLAGFARYFGDERFVFVVRDVMGTADFVAQRCADLGIRRFDVAVLAVETSGQAETVALGLDAIDADDDEPLTIFNIDTFRPGFAFPTKAWFTGSAGYLEVFTGSGANWSYVRPSENQMDRAIEVAEKRPISDLCCTGLYHFASIRDFRMAFSLESAGPESGELYVAPLYNHLIRRGDPIHYLHIGEGDVIFCGIPSEYQALGGRHPDDLNRPARSD